MSTSSQINQLTLDTVTFIRLIQELNSNTNGVDWVGLLGAAGTLIGIVVGAFVIKYQLNKQHEFNIQHQEKSFRDDLNLKIYESLSDKILVAQSKVSESAIKVWPLASNIERYWQLREMGLQNPEPIAPPGKTIIELNHEAEKACNDLTFLLERYQVQLPTFDVFRTAFNVHFREHLNAHQRVLDKAHRYLPTIIPPEMAQNFGNRRMLQVLRPTQEELEEIKQLGDAYFSVSSDIQSILMDLSVESQNYLLGSIFKFKAERRKPQDARHKVVVTSGPEYHEVKIFYQEWFDRLTAPYVAQTTPSAPEPG